MQILFHRLFSVSLKLRTSLQLTVGKSHYFIHSGLFFLLDINQKATRDRYIRKIEAHWDKKDWITFYSVQRSRGTVKLISTSVTKPPNRHTQKNNEPCNLHASSSKQVPDINTMKLCWIGQAEMPGSAGVLQILERRWVTTVLHENGESISEGRDNDYTTWERFYCHIVLWEPESFKCFSTFGM